MEEAGRTLSWRLRLGTAPRNTLVTASWPPELGEKDLVMFKLSLWPLVKAAPGDEVSLRTGPTVPAAGLAFHTSSRDVFTTTNLLTRGEGTEGPPLCRAHGPCGPGAAQHGPLWERRQVTAT